MQKAVHDGAVEQPQGALPDDIGMVSQHRWPLDPRRQAQDVAERPWEVIVDEVGPTGETLVHGECPQRHAAGCDFDIAAGAVDLDFL